MIWLSLPCCLFFVSSGGVPAPSIIFFSSSLRLGRATRIEIALEDRSAPVAAWAARLALVDPGVPNEEGSLETPPDPLEGAERAFVEHEADLVEELLAVAQRGIREDGTVGEAAIEMRRAMREDPEAQELVERLLAMILFGGGQAAMNWGPWWRANRRSPE